MRHQKNMYKYTRETHLKSLLNRKSDVPKEVMELISREIQNNSLDITHENIKNILKHHHLSLYYRDVSYIVQELTKSLDSTLHSILDSTLESITLTDNEECIICYEYVTECVKLTCNHVFCANCVEKIVANKNFVKCPLCRNISIVQKDLTLSDNDKQRIIEYYVIHKKNFTINDNGKNIQFSMIIEMIKDELNINS